jgi:hypothetical protein
VTLRPLPRSRLEGLIPSIVAGQHCVALVPVTGDARWAASAAWSVARAAVKSGRRVALVDLCVDQPQLHSAIGLPMGTGIVDAFQRGDDLTSAAQEVDGVFFIAAGTRTEAPEFVLAHPRWRKLHAGFRSEDALLLIYVSSGALARLADLPDGVIALAPEGVSLDSPPAGGLVSVQSQGAALLGVVRERWTPMGTPAPSVVIPPPVARHKPPRRGLAAAAFLAIMLLGAAAWVLFARDRGDAPGPLRMVSLPGAARPRPAAPPEPGAAPGADTLAWTVQLAAYGTLDNAMTHADRLAREGIVAFVTPVEATRAVWYRVLAGAFVSRDSAIAARGRWWDDKLARRGEGELLRAPYSLALPSTADADSLRHKRVPAVRLVPGGRLLLGAFENPEQAALAQAELHRAGIVTSLIARLEVRP